VVVIAAYAPMINKCVFQHFFSSPLVIWCLCHCFQFTLNISNHVQTCCKSFCTSISLPPSPNHPSQSFLIPQIHSPWLPLPIPIQLPSVLCNKMCYLQVEGRGLEGEVELLGNGCWVNNEWTWQCKFMLSPLFYLVWLLCTFIATSGLVTNCFILYLPTKLYFTLSHIPFRVHMDSTIVHIDST
jgi:hypothetical protein